MVKFKTKKYVVKFLRHRIDKSDVWFDLFDYSDVRDFFNEVVKLESDEEDIQHQEMNLINYLLGVGYIEEPNLEYSGNYRLTVKGYEYSETNFFERHPQFSGIFLGTSLSFGFALAKTGLDKILFTN